VALVLVMNNGVSAFPSSIELQNNALKLTAPVNRSAAA